jgi:ATP/maltotriose-dependent transcriptional regulator MalT
VTREEAERLLGLAREANFLGPEAATWVERLAPEREQLVEAARFLVGSGQEEAAAELAAGVWRLWLVSGDVASGRRLLAAALEDGAARPSRARALALYGVGLLAFRQGEQAESRARNEAALETARAVGDPEAEALALVGLSRVAFPRGRLRPRPLARARSAGADARPRPGRRRRPLHMLAAGTRLAGDHDGAAALYTESLELARRLGDGRMVGIELHNLGHVELHRGDVEAAEHCFAERAGIRNEDDPYEQAMTHLNRAALAFACGDRDLAADLLGRTEATLESSGIVLDPDDAFEVDWLRARLGS